MGKERRSFMGWMASHAGKLGFSVALLYIGHVYSTEIGRIEDYVRYRRNPVAIGTHHDPYGLRIEREIDNKGMLRSYITYDRTDEKVLITPDLYPPTVDMLRQIVRRGAAVSDDPEAASAYAQLLRKGLEDSL